MQHTILKIGEEIGDLRHRIEMLERNLGEILYWANRAIVLAVVWGMGLLSHFSADEAGRMAGEILRTLIAR